MRTDVDNMADAIQTELSIYYSNLVEGGKEAIDRVAKDTVAELKIKSPRRTGRYARSWKSTKVTGLSQFKYAKTVHNQEHYRLTHLLEYGHAKVNGGRTKEIPHIAPAETKAIEEIYKAFTELAKG